MSGKRRPARVTEIMDTRSPPGMVLSRSWFRANGGRMFPRAHTTADCTNRVVSHSVRQPVGHPGGSKYEAVLREIDERVAGGMKLRAAMEDAARRIIREESRKRCGVAVEATDGEVENRVRYFRRLRKVGGEK